MNAPVIAFFNNKGGVGKTSLAYHLAWMFAFQGQRVLAADLDPQANLTAAFLTEDELEQLWPDEGPRATIFGSISPLQRGLGDIGTPPVRVLENLPEARGELALIPGDLQLSSFEDELSSEWPSCLDGKERAFRVISSFSRLVRTAAKRQRSDVILVDVGPNLGAINRAALIASDFVVIPLAPDLFSLQGLRNLGPALVAWRNEWKDRLVRNKVSELDLPAGHMLPLGYVVLGHGVRSSRPVLAYRRWVDQIPGVFHSAVLGESVASRLSVDDDPYCLAQLKHYHSLLPLSHEAHKPVFALRSADGVFGGHAAAVTAAYMDFDALARKITDLTTRELRTG
ncbi:ParA family protein [Sphaerimonospora thailandensis]|uniref:Phage-related regulatory protein n=1 Tax=Sphaerimonospora thailandensis TaxID=795644 RepID=A0A8J3VXY2_9ACTN|nr:AAA family ATPase [Sphaerimonospora thailandensis]GIH68418.1 phage-related regulatory protein [Sphaerimonospora thailandensis]